MPQSQVTPAMTARAVAILNDPAKYPGPTSVTDPDLFFHDIETIDGVECMFYVMWHPPDPPVGPNAWHRGVSILVRSSAAPATYVEGIDLSHYQGSPDWSKVAASGKKFVFIKATEGASLVDGSFAYNWTAAKAAGILRGAYHFFRPAQDVNAQVANLTMKLAADWGELPVTIDVEVQDGVPLAQVDAAVVAFVNMLPPQSRPLVYTSPGFWALPPSSTLAAKTDLWIAHWYVTSPGRVMSWGPPRFWQYSAQGNVPGIVGAMDLDRWIGDEASLRAYASALPPSPEPSAFAFDMTTPRGVQGALNVLGYKPALQVDGIIGPKTSAAIAAFKANAGLLKS